MNYFFPSFLSLSDLDLEIQSRKLSFTVNSGANAIRLLIRSFNLSERSKIAVPLFVCDSVKRAVLDEGHELLYLDSKSGNTYWADYNSEKISQSDVSAVILVHLYGFIHPDTEEIMKFCKLHSIPLIHDAAQSFGINESLLTYSSGIVYSFSAGKSTTSAGGALVKGLSEKFYSENISSVTDVSIQTIHAKLFLKTRIYPYRYSLGDKLIRMIFSRIKQRDKIKTMSPFQQKMALVAMKLIPERKGMRIKNYDRLKEAIISNKNFEFINDSSEGCFFKIIFSIRSDPREFKKYLTNNNVPFFCLFDSFCIDKELIDKNQDFSNISSRIIELSSEASLPITEIKRIALLLAQYYVA